jgi:ABC-2 type transport system ATP-binding protein
MKLKLDKVGRREKDKWRLQDITYSCESGKVIGLIGNNGAGKTTLLKILAGQLKPSTGHITFESAEQKGSDFDDSCRAACIESESGYPNMTGHEMMCYIAAVNGIKDTNKILQLENEWDVPADKKIGKYSLGMIVRLNLAMTMLKSPQVLLLDEVFNGLDPSGQADCRKMLTEYARNDHIVMISSHSLYDIAAMADEILFIENGRIKKILKEHTDVRELAEYFNNDKVNDKNESDPV